MKDKPWENGSGISDQDVELCRRLGTVPENLDRVRQLADQLGGLPRLKQLVDALIAPTQQLSTGDKPEVKVVAKIPKVTPQQRERLRVKVCTDGTAGPYILCDPQDLTRLRVVLGQLGIGGVSFDPAVITDGSTQQGTSEAALVNFDRPGVDIDDLQRQLDAAFPYDIDQP